MKRKIILGGFAIVALITAAVILNVVSAQSSVSVERLDDGIAAAPAASATLVISQVYPGGGSSVSTVTYKKDYVEIKNISSTAESLSGLSLQYGSAAGNFGSSATTIYTLTNAGTLAAGQYYLVELGTPGTGGADLAPVANESTTNLSMAAASGKVALTNTPIGLGCGATATLCTLPDPRIIDLVSWGAATNPEGTASTATVNAGVALPANTNGGVRKAAGCTDTDNNNNDFDVIVGPIPRNASSPLAPCGAAASIEKKFRAYLKGSAEVPPNSSTATGFGRLTLNAAETQVKASFYFSGLGSNSTAGHIHGASVVGVSSGVIFDMTPPTGVTSGSAVDRVWTTVTPAEVADLKAGLWYFNIHSVNFPGGEIRGQILPFANADFDGDAKTDISVFRPSEGNWYVKRSSLGQNNPTITNWGISTDTLVPGDYDGDGKTDFAIWRPDLTINVADFYILNSSNFALTGFTLGDPGDTPVTGDYDGDGKCDLATFRSSTTNWYVWKSSAPTVVDTFQFGIAGDVAIGNSDFDGDGKADLAVFRPGDQFWYWNTATGTPAQNFGAMKWGVASDIKVPADYDGDGKTDIAVFRPSDGVWYIVKSTGGTTFTGFGVSGDVPVPGDYDGDGSDDLAVFRPSNATWYFLNSTSGLSTVPFGVGSDKPIPAAYHP